MKKASQLEWSDLRDIAAMKGLQFIVQQDGGTAAPSGHAPAGALQCPSLHETTHASEGSLGHENASSPVEEDVASEA